MNGDVNEVIRLLLWAAGCNW